jgi:pyruvate formate lyase activating enzyme
MIRGRIDTSMVDWDGMLATVLFFDRCNFKCPFCQNWELMTRPENYPAIDIEEVIHKLTDRRDWIDGVVLTGGEPLVDPEELRPVIAKIRKLGFKIKIDTNGSTPDRLERLIKDRLVDYVAMDVKAPLDGRYQKAAGVRVDPEKIRASVRVLLSGAVNHEFRTTLVPEIIDGEALRMIGEELRGAKKWFLQVFVAKNAPPGEFRDKKFAPAEIDRFLAIAREYVPDARLRGTIQ